MHSAVDVLVSGRALFLAHCAACHTVRGTPAESELGPDLTHLASRLSIGAGNLPNNHGTVTGWIASNQHIEPGDPMPEVHTFDRDELQALRHWLETLE